MSEAVRTHFTFRNSGECARVEIRYRVDDAWNDELVHFKDRTVCILDRTGRRLVDVGCTVGEVSHLGFSFWEGVTPHPDWSWCWGPDWLLIAGPGELTIAEWSSIDDEEVRV